MARESRSFFSEWVNKEVVLSNLAELIPLIPDRFPLERRENSEISSLAGCTEEMRVWMLFGGLLRISPPS